MKYFLSFLLAIGPLLASHHITKDYSKGKDLAEGHYLPLALVFTGSDWSESSKALMESLSNELLASEMVIVHVDFPELNRQETKILSQNHALKEKYNIDHFPTVVLIDQDENEMTRLGYPLQNVSNYPEHLRQIGRRYFLLQKRFEKAKQERLKKELKLFFEEAQNLGATSLANTILEENYQEVPELMLEKYCTLENSPQKDTLRKKLNQCKNPEIHSRLTLIDFQENEDPSLLEDYIATFSEKTGDHCWKMHMVLSEYLKGEKALEHAQVSHRYAPPEEKETIGKIISKMLPSRSPLESQTESERDCN